MTALVRHIVPALAFSALIPVAAGDEFRDQIQPFLKSYCVACHGPKVQKGKTLGKITDGDKHRKAALAEMGKLVAKCKGGTDAGS